MRTIKFRAWNKAEQRMYHDVGVNPCGQGYPVFDKDGAIIDAYGSAPELMQFTGIVDCHGREVYEGDIVRVCAYASTMPLFEVFWREELPGFYLKAMRVIDARCEWIDLMRGGNVDDYEVIGNIYETKGEAA